VQLHLVTVRGREKSGDLPILQGVLVGAPGGHDDRRCGGRCDQRAVDRGFIGRTDCMVVARQVAGVGCPPREQIPHVQAYRSQRSGVTQAPPNGLVIVDSSRGRGVQHCKVHRRTLTGQIARQVIPVAAITGEQCCGCALVLTPHRVSSAHTDHPLRI
jgi:hypothetical protein